MILVMTDGVGNNAEETNKDSHGKVEWVYQLSKSSLVPLFFAQQLLYGGPTIPLANPEKLPAELLRPANEGKKKDPAETNKTDPTETPKREAVTVELTEKDRFAEIRSVQKWEIKFSGAPKDSPVDFQERPKELQRLYSIGDGLVRPLPLILEGQALLWYRNVQSLWKSWSDFEESFQNSFFPVNYVEELDEEAKGRKQKANEKIGDYNVVMLMCFRRYGGFDSAETRRIFYKNLRSEYKYFIREDYTTLTIAKMVALGKKYETIKEDENEMKSQTKSDTHKIEKDTEHLWEPPNTIAPRMCWLCKMAGHFTNECPLSKSKAEIMQSGQSENQESANCLNI